MTAHDLLIDLQRQGFSLTPLPDGKLEIRPASRLSEELREQIRRYKAEVLALVSQQQEERFLSQHVPQPALEVFSDWQGILVKSSVLDLSIWVVRTRQEGEELARETGHPALLLDDVLRQEGRRQEEARAALLPLLITGTVQ
jgi:hypothetical protein